MEKLLFHDLHEENGTRAHGIILLNDNIVLVEFNGVQWTVTRLSYVFFLCNDNIP